MSKGTARLLSCADMQRCSFQRKNKCVGHFTVYLYNCVFDCIVNLVGLSRLFTAYSLLCHLQHGTAAVCHRNVAESLVFKRIYPGSATPHHSGQQFLCCAGQNFHNIDSLFTGGYLGTKSDIADGSLRDTEFRYVTLGALGIVQVAIAC